MPLGALSCLLQAGTFQFMKILFLEDDLQLGTALSRVLHELGYEVCWVRLVADARGFLLNADEVFSAALLDICLPDGDGLGLLAELRAAGQKLPIIMLTARDSVRDRVRGLDEGADDYLPKPFAVDELISRLRALTRRSAGYVTRDWRIGPLRIDPLKQRVWLNDEIVELSPREYLVLKALASNAGRILTRSQIELHAMEGQGGEGNVIEVYIHHLRRKLGQGRITTVRGVGYMLEDSTQ